MSHFRKGHKWPKGKVPYTYDSKVKKSTRLREWIEDVMEEIENACGVRFSKRDGQKQYIHFRLTKENRGSANEVGRESSHFGLGGRSEIDIPKDWSGSRDETLGTLRHELMHALGFYHEHERRDHADHIIVLRENIPAAEYRDNYEPPSSSESKHVGPYDLDSIMHYHSFGGEYRWTIGTDCIGSVENAAGQVFLVRYNRLVSASTVNRVRWRTVCEPVGLKFEGIANKFKTVITYSVEREATATRARSVRNFVFLLSEQTGKVRIRRINSDGSLGAVTFSKTWTTGWSTAAATQVDGKTYLIMLKKTTGLVRVHRLSFAGNVASMTDEHDWTDGYTHIVPATVYAASGDARTYLLFHKSGTGEINVHRLSGDGNISGRKQHYNWSGGWTSFTTWASEGPPRNTFVVLLKKSDGRIRVHRVRWNGKLGGYVDSKNWTSNYTSACVLWSHLRNYALLITKNLSGVTQVHRLGDDGTIGGEIDPFTHIERNGARIFDTNNLSPGDLNALRSQYP